MKERLAGTILLCALVPLAILGYLLIVIIGTFGSVKRVRQGVRALDHFVNATIFNGYACESISSHAWRNRHKKWAKFVIKLTDFFQKDHCKRANRREQPIVDLYLSKKLDKQTVGKQI
ncbi:hypothetical protein [Campylobacter sp. CCS1377]|uniref:Uncharacterized protein n=1 Tax=Campylobacter sp. CCS1377 TaxID=3158229 RepID=A0AAU7E6A8_9BACT|nr:hypothetical protein [Campylobacter jejuni]